MSYLSQNSNTKERTGLTNTGRFVGLAVALVLVSSCGRSEVGLASEAGTSTTAPKTATTIARSAEAFAAELQKFRRADFQPNPTFASMASKSDLVIRGKMGAPVERDFRSEGDDSAIKHIVFPISVTEVIGGSDPAMGKAPIFLVVSAPPSTLEAVTSVMPSDNDILVFVKRYVPPESASRDGIEKDAIFVSTWIDGLLVQGSEKALMGGDARLPGTNQRLTLDEIQAEVLYAAPTTGG